MSTKHRLGKKVCTAELPIYEDDSLYLTMAWAHGQTGDGREFQVNQVLGGGGLLITLRVGEVNYSCDLGPIVKTLIAATAPKDKTP